MDENCGTDVKEEARQIKGQITLLATSREKLLDKIANLSARLGPALRDEPPGEPSTEAEVDEQLVDIAANIREIRCHIEADTRTIMNILGRLEI